MNPLEPRMRLSGMWRGRFGAIRRSWVFFAGKQRRNRMAIGTLWV